MKNEKLKESLGKIKGGFTYLILTKNTLHKRPSKPDRMNGRHNGQSKDMITGEQTE